MASGVEKSIKEIQHLLDQVKKDCESKTDEKDKEIERLKEEIEKQKDVIYKLQMAGSELEKECDEEESKFKQEKSDEEKLKEEILRLTLRNIRLTHENHDLDCLRGLDHCEMERLKKENNEKEATIQQLQEGNQELLLMIAEQGQKLQGITPPEEVKKLKKELESARIAYNSAFERANKLRDILESEEYKYIVLLSLLNYNKKCIKHMSKSYRY